MGSTLGRTFRYTTLQERSVGPGSFRLFIKSWVRTRAKLMALSKRRIFTNSRLGRDESRNTLSSNNLRGREHFCS